MKLIVSTTIQCNFREAFRHFDEKLFRALKPPGVSLEVIRFDGCKKGDEVHLKVAGQKWISHITELHEDDAQIYFIDIGVVVPAPIKEWKHVHRIEYKTETSCVIIEDIDYSTGNTFLDKVIYPAMKIMFKMRAPVYKKELEGKS